MGTPHRALRNLYTQKVHQFCTPQKIPASPFMKRLGFGTGVSVYRFERSPQGGQARSPWAVKRVTKELQCEKEIFNARITEEAKILRNLSHPNIVGFRCVTKTNDGMNTLALECCTSSLGDILEVRFDEQLGPLPPKDILRFIVDISAALDYLHNEAKLLHGDLKSFNVLVKGDFQCCKLCDFGVSVPLDENGQVNMIKNPNLRYVGTSLWSAPEVMDELQIFDCKADIFSFGLVIYETIALVPPHTLSISKDSSQPVTEDLVNSESSVSQESYCSSQELVAYGTRPPLPNAQDLGPEYNRIVELFYLCTMETSEDRPLAQTIWQAASDASGK